MRVRVGEISFANFFPFCAKMEYPASCEVLRAHPKILNDECRKGALDISPISFYAYNDIKSEYEILSNFTIASDGEVDSVKLYSDCEIADLKGKRIYFTDKSESSISAFCAICKKKFGFNPYEFACGDKDNVQAMFLIGDDVFTFKNRFQKSWDIGSLWKETFATPMVYAVIVAKRNLSENLKSEFAARYCESLAEFFSNREKYVKIISERFSKAGDSSNEARIKSYFSKLIFRQDKAAIEKVLDILNGKFD